MYYIKIYINTFTVNILLWLPVTAVYLDNRDLRPSDKNDKIK